MYLDHYKLREKPFQITADPRFLWLGEKHQEALAMLKYGVMDGRGFLLLTGDVGTGKTTLINSLLNSLDDDVIVATIPDPGLEPMEFFDFLAGAFGIQHKFTRKTDFLKSFEQFLNEAHSSGKRVLLIMDEAQRLSVQLLEEIRLLSNMEKAESKLLTVFFVGQDEFKDILMADECRALRQRIATMYRIKPLTGRETAQYIRHRLSVAGTKEELFSLGAVQEIFEFSRGYPRLINILCDHALLTGYVRDIRRIDPVVVLECAQELAIHREAKPVEVEVPRAQNVKSVRWRNVWRRAVLYGVLALALGFCGYLFYVEGYAGATRNVKDYYGQLLGLKAEPPGEGNAP